MEKHKVKPDSKAFHLVSNHSCFFRVLGWRLDQSWGVHIWRNHPDCWILTVSDQRYLK